MATLHVLRVFLAEDGGGGNPLGVFLDGAEIPEERRQAVAAELGFSETVFVDDRESGSCRIFTPATELPFAGHPLLGTAWLLGREGHAAERLRPPAGEVEVRHEGELTFVAAHREWVPEFALIQFGDAASVEHLPGPPAGERMAYCWAWENEEAGVVRSRCFPLGAGIEEDEATGSAAIALSVELGREVTIHQGRGSRLQARPLGGDRAEVGGRVALSRVRRLPSG